MYLEGYTQPTANISHLWNIGPGGGGGNLNNSHFILL